MVIKVVVVEDDARLRGVLGEVLSSSEDCQCVAMFSNGSEAIKSLPALKPDVVIMDVNLPDVSGVECVRQLSPQLPGTHIIMLTIYQDPDTIFQALAAGAHGYLVKPVMADKLLAAVREIWAGGAPMSRSIARKVIDAFRDPGRSPAAGVALEDAALSERERQVLDLLVAGLTYKEIADRLEITVSTVGTYVQRIYEKLHVRSRGEIIARIRGGVGEGGC